MDVSLAISCPRTRSALRRTSTTAVPQRGTKTGSIREKNYQWGRHPGARGIWHGRRSRAELRRVRKEKPVYKITNIKRIDKKTNLVSSAIQGPGNVTYSETTTATSLWGGSAEVGGEISVIVAKLNSKVSINHSKTWSKSKSWRYTLHIAKGKTQRIRMFHRHSQFKVTKLYFHTGLCKYKTQYTKTIHVPCSGSADNVWKRENV